MDSKVPERQVDKGGGILLFRHQLIYFTPTAHVIFQDLPHYLLHCPISLANGREAKIVRLQSRGLSPHTPRKRSGHGKSGKIH